MKTWGTGAGHGFVLGGRCRSEPGVTISADMHCSRSGRREVAASVEYKENNDVSGDSERLAVSLQGTLTSNAACIIGSLICRPMSNQGYGIRR